MSSELESNMTNPPVPYTGELDQNIYEYLLAEREVVVALQKDVVKLQQEIQSLQNSN